MVEPYHNTFSKAHNENGESTDKIDLENKFMGLVHSLWVIFFQQWYLVIFSTKGNCCIWEMLPSDPLGRDCMLFGCLNSTMFKNKTNWCIWNVNQFSARQQGGSGVWEPGGTTSVPVVTGPVIRFGNVLDTVEVEEEVGVTPSQCADWREALPSADRRVARSDSDFFDVRGRK